MANWCLLLPIVLALISQTITARDVPSETNKRVVSLTDQKNVFAGLGGFAGLNNNEQPIGGGGIGVGIGVGIGNTNAIGGVGLGYGGPGSAAGGGLGTFVGLDNGYGGVPTVGGGGLGAGDDDGAVPLP